MVQLLQLVNLLNVQLFQEKVIRQLWKELVLMLVFLLSQHNMMMLQLMCL